MNRFVKSVLIVSAVCVVAAPAMAELSATFTMPNSTRVDLIDPNNALHQTYTGMTVFTNVSYLGHTAFDTSPLEGLVSGSPLNAFCVDLKQTVNFNTSSSYWLVKPTEVPVPATPEGPGNDMLQPMDATRASLLTHFYNAHYDELTDGLGNDVVEQQAFQLAVWEIVYEDGLPSTYSLTGGELYWSAFGTSARDQANTWFNDATWTSATGNWRLVGLSHDPTGTIGGDGQDFVVAVQIPVPGAILLGLFGFGLIGWIKRRFA